MTDGTDATRDTAWLELSVEAHMEAVEPVSELFARYGFNEGVVIEEPYLQERDGDNVRVDTSRPATIRTFLAKADTDPARIEDIRRGLFHLNQIQPVGELIVTERAEEDWAHAWKAFYKPVRVGRRVVVRPPWRDYEGQPSDVVVILDPGMAFGTGTHPTTRLAMAGLEDAITSGARVIDVGTGSGVLAIAAAKLGASLVDAFDIEPVSVRSARENVERNELPVPVRVEVGSDVPGGPFDGRVYDLVVANIIARVLVELVDGITGAVAEGGTLVLAGIIEPREKDVIDAYTSRGFVITARDQIEDWIGMTLRRG
ncbi:MAG TPA: 50S ribosomal protein L11 methyltransferase [Thermomicrobiales bacterium]|jgi:ribosomal protein L11 methyltransferase|nr:50S ribosomal protein L11 methyltransferase [Thermomicrobiales bacterium]